MVLPKENPTTSYEAFAPTIASMPSATIAAIASAAVLSGAWRIRPDREDQAPGRGKREPGPEWCEPSAAMIRHHHVTAQPPGPCQTIDPTGARSFGPRRSAFHGALPDAGGDRGWFAGPPQVGRSCRLCPLGGVGRQFIDAVRWLPNLGGHHESSLLPPDCRYL